MKRERETEAARPYAVEYYTKLWHRNPWKRGFCLTEENAYVKAGEHLDRGHYEKAVVVKRKPGLVVVTRFKFGVHRFDRSGDLPQNGAVLNLQVKIPAMKEN